VTVKSGPKKFHSKKQVDGKYSKVLNTTGKYKIYCTLHPGMQMTITVKPAPVTTTTAYPPAT
jgi:plastocyanin